MSLIPALLSGALGGLVATFGAKWLWWVYSRPTLRFASGVIKDGETHPEEPWAWGQYRVEVTNDGRSVATNCKPQIRFEGTRETTEKRPDVEPDGEMGFREVSVKKRYVLDVIPDWNESESPSRIDLNRGEVARFDLFSVHSEAAPPEGSDTRIRFGDQKSLDEIEESREVWNTEPMRVETSTSGDFSRPIVDTKPELTKDEFEEIEWTSQAITITSADANKLNAELLVEWSDVIPTVSIEEDTTSVSVPQWFTYDAG